MKIVKLKSMGGSGKTATQHVVDADMAEKIARFKRGYQARVAAIKRHLAQFIEKTTHPADGSCVTTALLEFGFERQLDLHGEEDAKDLIDRAFRRVVKERRGPLNDQRPR